MVEQSANSGDPDQKLHSVASDLGLHCLPNTLLGVSRLQWVKPQVFLCWLFEGGNSVAAVLCMLVTVNMLLYLVIVC